LAELRQAAAADLAVAIGPENPQKPLVTSGAAAAYSLVMTSAAYLPFLIQIVLAAGIGAVIIGASHFFGQRAPRTPSRTPRTSAA